MNLFKRHKMKQVIPGLALLLAFSGVAHGEEAKDQCTADVYTAVSRDMKLPALSAREGGGNVISAACRVWPYQPALQLAAIAYDEGRQNEKRLAVAVIDAGT